MRVVCTCHVEREENNNRCYVLMWRMCHALRACGCACATTAAGTRHISLVPLELRTNCIVLGCN